MRCSTQRAVSYHHLALLDDGKHLVTVTARLCIGRAVGDGGVVKDDQIGVWGDIKLVKSGA